MAPCIGSFDKATAIAKRCGFVDGDERGLGELRDMPPGAARKENLRHWLHTASADADIAVDVNAHQEAKAYKDGEHRCAAVGNQR